MTTNRWSWVRGAPVALLLVALLPAGASAQWAGLSDESTALSTDRYAFFGSNPEAGGNENYYDGDLGDFDGDGLPDRHLGARYGLLFNTGGGYMVPVRRHVGYLLRGDAGASGWGEDGMALIDVDNDGDLDALSGGNGEPLSCQINDQWRWRVLWSERGHSALNIVPTDIDNDGDADMLVAHSFCAQSNCGGPVDFDLMVNDGTGNFTEESAARGIARASGEFVVGAVSGDLDNDGDFDIILQIGTTSGTGLKVGMNDGTGHFTTTFYPQVVGGSGFGQNMALGDMNGDGYLDYVLGRYGIDGASGGHPRIAHRIGLGDGTGRFTDVSATHFDPGSFSGELVGENAAIADIDYDGDLDFIALKKARMADASPHHHVSIFLNDGTGHLTYSDAHSMILPGRGSGLGADVDIADLDGDGDYDLWVGAGSDVVHILMNQHVDPSGLPADQPRNLRVVSTDSNGVTIGWQHPPFASNARSYHVYRSLADRLHDRDRELIRVVGQSRHLDRDFYGTIDQHTTAAMLHDADVTIDPSGEVRFVDRTAVPGVTYFYTVAHVGPEHDESAHAPEVSATIAGPSGADTNGPEITIVSPTASAWMRSPRVVVTYGDDQSGVDMSTLRVSFDAALGPLAADADITSMAYRFDNDAFIAYLAPPHLLPADSLVTMNVELADRAGNVTRESVQMFVNTLPSIRTSPMSPSAAFDATPTSGMAPLDVAFDASASADPDGPLLRWEWYFGDGETGIGRQVSHRFEYGGTFDVTLLVRDAEGNAATTTQTLTLTGMPPTDGGPPGLDGGVGDGGPMGCVPQCDRASCGDDGCGGVCGTCGAGQTCTDQQCVCADGAFGCGDVCGIDLDNDPMNCGACGNQCGDEQMCVSGACEGGETTPDDGCSCRAAGGGRGGDGALALLGLALLGIALRRLR